MSLKLLKLRWRIFFWTITGRIKKMQSRLQLTLSQGNPENILIIFPMDEPSFRVACYAFRDLGKENVHKRQFIFIVKEQFKDLFHLHVGAPIMVENSDYDRVLSDEKEILEKVQNTRYDMVIDLNSNFHLGIARLVSLIRGDMKIGFSNEFSDLFYNIQLDISKSGIMEKGYKQINTILAS